MSFIRPLFIFLSLALLTSCESPLLDHIKESKLNPIGGRDGLEQQREGVLLSNLGLRLVMKWAQGPFGDPTLESALELKFTDTDGLPMDLPEDVELIHYSYMPSMGHGPADEGYLIHEYSGHYLIKEIFFSMPGDWTLTLEFKRAGGKVDEAAIELFL